MREKISVFAYCQKSAGNNNECAHSETAFRSGNNGFHNTGCAAFLQSSIFAGGAVAFGKKRGYGGNGKSGSGLGCKEKKPCFCAAEHCSSDSGNKKRRSCVYAKAEHPCGGFRRKPAPDNGIVYAFCRSRIAAYCRRKQNSAAALRKPQQPGYGSERRRKEIRSGAFANEYG